MVSGKDEESNVPADELSRKTESRRDFTKKLAYASPLILTLDLTVFSRQLSFRSFASRLPPSGFSARANGSDKKCDR